MLSRNDVENIIERIDGNNNKKPQLYFTTKDILEIENYLETHKGGHTLLGLIDYFNAKFKCNRIVKILTDVITKGILIKPEIAYQPITEKVDVVDGYFKLTNKPYNMRESYFIHDLVVVKLPDGTYLFYDNPKYDEEKDLWYLGEKVTGKATVSYYINSDEVTISAKDFIDKLLKTYMVASHNKNLNIKD